MPDQCEFVDSLVYIPNLVYNANQDEILPQKIKRKVRDKVQGLSTHIALAKDLSSVPSTHFG